MSRSYLLVILALAACRGGDPDTDSDTEDTEDSGAEDTDTEDTEDTDVPPVDADGDGFDETSDCDEGDAAVNPGAAERCDGVDQDCDGVIDEDAVDASTWYADGDGDGYGDVEAGATACTAPAGHVADATDCDDTNAALNPAATEACDGVDQDCDGVADDGLATSTHHRDADGDSYGDPGDTKELCKPLGGYIVDGTDCHDADATSNPAAAEVYYDGYDQNCDGKDDYDKDGDGSQAAPRGADLDDDDPACAAQCFNGSTPSLAGQSCAAILERHGGDTDLYYIDADLRGEAFAPLLVHCDMETDGGGWTLALYIVSGNHDDVNERNASALGDFASNAKLSDELIRALAAGGEGEAMVEGASSTYILRYDPSEWGAYDSTGWKNAIYDAKGADGAWTTNACNGHKNNRGFSTYNDGSASACPVSWSGSPAYMAAYHTQFYPQGVGTPFGVYLR